MLSLARLARICDIDALDLTMTIEAGVTLKAAQIAATDAGACRRCPSHRRQRQIGGVLAVNAGGNNTVRYGNARDLVLGLRWCCRTARCGTAATVAQGQYRYSCGSCSWAPRARWDHHGGVRSGAAAARGLRGAVRSPHPEALQLFGRFQSHDASAINAFADVGAGHRFRAAEHRGRGVAAASRAELRAGGTATPRPDAGLRMFLNRCWSGH